MSEKKPEVLVNTGEAMVSGKIYLPPDPEPVTNLKDDIGQVYVDIISSQLQKILSKDSRSC